jgi:hypothetical protein
VELMLAGLSTCESTRESFELAAWEACGKAGVGPRAMRPRWSGILRALAYPSPQLSTTSTSTSTGTRSEGSASRPGFTTLSLPTTMTSSRKAATSSACSLGHATTNSSWAR